MYVSAAGSRMGGFGVVEPKGDLCRCNGNCRAVGSGAVGRSHTHELRVRYSECDMQGHVFNANWLAYFDLAYTELWRSAVGGGWEDVTARGIDLVVAEANVSFRSPGRFDDRVALTAEVERLGSTSITAAFTARRVGGERSGEGRGGDAPGEHDRLLVEGRMVHVVVDAKDFTKREIPVWVREALA